MTGIAAVLKVTENSGTPIPTQLRLTLYIVCIVEFFGFALLYVAVATILNCFESSKKGSGLFKCGAAFIVDGFLLIAGVLYLVGDNIRLVTDDFDAPVGGLKARDFRSYLVAFSLCFMVISRIEGYVTKYIAEYRKPNSVLTLTANFDRVFDLNKFWVYTGKYTLTIPAGHYKRWKEGTTLTLKLHDLKTDASIQKSEAVNVPTYTSPVKFNGSQLCDHQGMPTEEATISESAVAVTSRENRSYSLESDRNSSTSKQSPVAPASPTPRVILKAEGNELEVIVELQYSGETKTTLSLVPHADTTVLLIKVRSNECIGIRKAKVYSADFDCTEEVYPPWTTIQGKSPTINFKVTNDACTWLMDFQRVEKDEEDSQRISGEEANASAVKKYSKVSLVQLFRAYVSILDYALIADAFYTTILDEIKQKDTECPTTDVRMGLSLAILGIMSVIWIIVVLGVLPTCFCCGHSYRRLVSFREPYEYMVKMCKTALTISRDGLLYATKDRYKFIKDNRKPIAAGLLIMCFWLLMFETPIFFLILGLAIIIAVNVVVVYITLITPVLLLMAVVLLVIAIIAALLLLITVLLSAAVFLYIILTPVLLIVCCYLICKYCCRCSQKIRCKNCSVTCCCCEGSFAIVNFVLILMLSMYLPAYLIADNSWPWECYNPDKWSSIRIGILISSLVFSLPFFALSLIDKVKGSLDSIATKLTQKLHLTGNGNN
jgi:hypothetical protein